MNPKKLLSFILIFVTVCTLTGCKKEEAKKEKDFDAGGYVKAYLDAYYKGEYKKYLDFSGMTEEEIQSELTVEADNQIAAALSYMELSDEEKDSYYAFSQKLYALSNYTVGKVEKDKQDAYIVLVKIQPCSFWLDYYAGIEERLTLFSGSRDSFTDSDLFTEEMNYMNECMGTITYGEETEITVTVKKDDSSDYRISEKDITLLKTTMFPVE